ncbi:MAG TPA: thioredoxin domain-containing protein, partial [Planctomycetota bacterium]|nr:thioredoxin domain-containing protein [Planctomycetota bacterium]
MSAESDRNGREPNRLARETSPYLLQHALNPVDWYPWGEEAFRHARDRDVPIFLSVGYSSCHWCHVMERESFEDPETARLMNERFVNVKVDREERPDVDAVYMNAVQLMTGHGGWPMSVYLDHDLRPFWGGTYFPPERRHGMPSFRDVIEAISNAWKTKRGDLAETASRLVELLSGAPARSGREFSVEDFDRFVAVAHRTFDREHGGFG